MITKIWTYVVCHNFFLGTSAEKPSIYTSGILWLVKILDDNKCDTHANKKSPSLIQVHHKISFEIFCYKLKFVIILVNVLCTRHPKVWYELYNPWPQGQNIQHMRGSNFNGEIFREKSLKHLFFSITIMFTSWYYKL